MNPGWRSLLFVAADDQQRLEKIAARKADAIILDLEDGVPGSRKVAARENVAAAAADLASQGCSIVVRINVEWRAAFADLEAISRPEIAAIMVPKVESGARLSVVAEIVAELAIDKGLSIVPKLIPLIESPAGLSAVEQIAAIPQVIGLALGTEDLALALGTYPSPAALDLPCRMLALAAARRGQMALGLPLSIATIDDLKAWAEGVREARAFGMTGALCVHPRQVCVANEGFSPTSVEIETARRIVHAWTLAPGAGAIQLDGKMVDRPIMLAAQRVLEQSRSADGD